jgi:hypothetical protein
LESMLFRSKNNFAFFVDSIGQLPFKLALYKSR